VQLSSIDWRGGGAPVQSWTSAYVPGKRYGKEKPVYVLTSAKTVSAAEGFAYNLQAAKRATIIGETTVGGANPGNIFRAGDHFRVQIAQGRAVNPVTKTNWEGKGVKPDVAVRADLALATAEVMALEGRAEKTDDKERKEEIERAMRSAREELDPLKRAPAK
jgi:C-terminal processing protease CtpA/Prc